MAAGTVDFVFDAAPEPVLRVQQEYSAALTRCNTGCCLPLQTCLRAHLCCRSQRHRRAVPKLQLPERCAKVRCCCSSKLAWAQPAVAQRALWLCCAGVKWSPDGACLLTASDDCWCASESSTLPPPASQERLIGECLTGSAGCGCSTCPPTRSSGPAWQSAARRRRAQRARRASGPADSAAPALRVYEGETVYDYAWYPGMLSSDPASCVFASTSRVPPRFAWAC